MEATFDRFDICEGWMLWAHDWGEYAIITRLERMRFRMAPARSYETLSDNGKAIYNSLNARSFTDERWYERERGRRWPY